MHAIRQWSRQLVVVTVLSVAAVAQASAQQCLGAMSFNRAPVQVGASAAFHDAANRYEAEVSGGGSFGFAKASLGFRDFKFASERSSSVGVSAGRSVATSGGALSLCPMAMLTYGRGPNSNQALLADGTVLPVKVSTIQAGGGAAVGARLQVGQRATLLPFASTALLWNRVAVAVDDIAESRSHNFGLVSVGAGLVFNEFAVLRPAINFPIGTDREATTMSLAMSLAVGRRR